MRIHGEYLKDCKIDSVDICTILTNLLDNAVEACVKQPEDEPREMQHFTAGYTELKTLDF